jgi:U2 small nuclear ribonucleoprotein A'
MRLTTELINNSLSFINCLTERELDLRGAWKRADATLAS